MMGIGLFSLLWPSKIYQQPMVVFSVLGFSMATGRFWRTVVELPNAARCTFLVILFLSLSAQFCDFGRTTFPFVRWSMYSESDANVISIFRYQATTLGGEEFEWNPVQLALTYSEHRLYEGLAMLARQDKPALKVTLDALVKLANRTREDPICRVSVERAM